MIGKPVTIVRYMFGVALLLAMTARATAGTLVQFHMFVGVNNYVGDVEVELYDQDKPITVKNFLNYLNGGYYQNNFFHRCIPGFVLQGGGASTSTPFSTNLFQALNYVPSVFGQITNEFNFSTRRSNTFGTLAMARTTNLNSATSQFFFNLADNSGPQKLDDPTNYYAVFGHVLRGANILNFFNTVSKNGNGVIDTTYFYGTNSDTQFLSDLPVGYVGLLPPRYEDLVYMNISTLNLQARPTNNTMQLTWNSINALTNNIEFTTNFPANWQVLTNPVGNGTVMTATDTNKLTGRRFYRVHVLY